MYTMRTIETVLWNIVYTTFYGYFLPSNKSFQFMKHNITQKNKKIIQVEQILYNRNEQYIINKIMSCSIAYIPCRQSKQD